MAYVLRNVSKNSRLLLAHASKCVASDERSFLVVIVLYHRRCVLRCHSIIFLDDKVVYNDSILVGAVLLADAIIVISADKLPLTAVVMMDSHDWKYTVQLQDDPPLTIERLNTKFFCPRCTFVVAYIRLFRSAINSFCNGKHLIKRSKCSLFIPIQQAKKKRLIKCDRSWLRKSRQTPIIFNID